ncbi:MAG: hypothetical protein KME13_17890 [Myxacorys californica WJT36-NPBG1]|nr:hypothetical protein [Myxacorys californica WJT36-NPBG1]
MTLPQFEAEACPNRVSFNLDLLNFSDTVFRFRLRQLLIERLRIHQAALAPCDR